MLQQIRDRATGWVAGLIFGLIALAFVFWGVTGYRGGAGAFFAKVNGEEIPERDYRDAFRNRMNQARQLYPDSIPEAVEQTIRENTIRSVIERELLDQYAQDVGYGIGRDQLVQNIQQFPQFQVDGQFSPDIYRARLASVGMSDAYFESQMHRDLRIGQIQDSINRTAFTTPSELRRALELQNQTRDVSFVLFPVSRYQNDIRIADEDVVSYYETHAQEFMTPEMVNVEYIEIRQSDHADEVQIDSDELADYYEVEVAAGRFVTREQRRARHILIAVGPDSNEDEAAATAESLLARLQDGADFTELAAEHSDDPGSAVEGGDLGWAERDAFVGAFGDALFEMEVGEVEGPVRSEFGFHIIELIETRGGDQQPFDEVRQELEAELKAQQSEEAYYRRVENLRDAAYEALDNLDAVSERLGVEVNKLTGVTRAGGPDLAANEAVLDLLFSDAILRKGENSTPIQVDDGRHVVVRVAEHHEPETRPLDEVRDSIVTTLKTERAAMLAGEDGEALLRDVETGASITETAASYGVEVEESTLSRTRFDVSPEIMSVAFSAPKGTVDNPTVTSAELANGDYAVIVVKDVRPGSPVGLDQQMREQQQKALSGRSGFAEFTAYVENLRNDATIVIPERTDETEF